MYFFFVIMTNSSIYVPCLKYVLYTVVTIHVGAMLLYLQIRELLLDLRPFLSILFNLFFKSLFPEINAYSLRQKLPLNNLPEISIRNIDM